MRIREAYLGETEDMARMAMQLFPDRDEDIVFSDLLLALTGRSSAVYLAEADGTPIGFALCRLHHEDVKGTDSTPVGYLEAIYVQPEYRRQGIGRKLLQESEKWAREKMACTELASDCRTTDPEALAFFLRMGYLEADRIVCLSRKL